MTGEMQRHRALQRFLLVHGREMLVPTKEYYVKFGHDKEFGLCAKDGLLKLTTSKDIPTQVKIHITKKGFQYLKRNPYKRAKQNEQA